MKFASIALYALEPFVLCIYVCYVLSVFLFVDKSIFLCFIGKHVHRSQIRSAASNECIYLFVCPKIFVLLFRCNNFMAFYLVCLMAVIGLPKFINHKLKSVQHQNKIWKHCTLNKWIKMKTNTKLWKSTRNWAICLVKREIWCIEIELHLTLNCFAGNKYCDGLIYWLRFHAHKIVMEFYEEFRDSVCCC